MPLRKQVHAKFNNQQQVVYRYIPRKPMILIFAMTIVVLYKFLHNLSIMFSDLDSYNNDNVNDNDNILENIISRRDEMMRKIHANHDMRRQPANTEGRKRSSHDGKHARHVGEQRVPQQQRKRKVLNNETLCLLKLPYMRYDKAAYIQHKVIQCDKKKPRNSDTYHRHPPPRRIVDTNNPVYFLHVGKAGGSSIDYLVGDILKCQHKRYIGDLHYDWSYIQKHMYTNKAAIHSIDDDISTKADVITFLRHPVSRSVSQFYFSKTLPWANRTNSTILYQTFDEYLDQPNGWMQPIADGESGSSFLAGIFPTDKDLWVASDGRETELKAHLRENKTAACLFAAERLENTTWFGLLEDLERSMTLLQLTLDLEFTPILPKSNPGKLAHPLPTNDTIQKIQKYVPKDLWFYEFAKRLFEARWRYFKDIDCEYVPPELPPLPTFE